MRATLKNYRQSPRKVRLVAELIKNKPVDRALILLETTTKRATHQMAKLLHSAVANARDKSISQDKLWVKNVTVDDGATLRRIRPVSRGAAHPIRKRTSNITVELGEKKIT